MTSDYKNTNLDIISATFHVEKFSEMHIQNYLEIVEDTPSNQI